jgi:hypothetical protein
VSTRNVVTTGVIFLIVAVFLAVSQLEAGGWRVLLGIGLALQWAASGVAVIRWPREGAWLGLAVAAISLVGAGWIMSQANVAEGRWIAELLYASSDGDYSWTGVFMITFLFAIAALWCIGATIWLLRHDPSRAHAGSPQARQASE